VNIILKAKISGFSVAFFQCPIGYRYKTNYLHPGSRFFPVFKRKIVDYDDFQKKEPEKRASGSFGTKYNSREVSPNYRPPYSKRGGEDNTGDFSFLDTILPSYMYSDNGY